MYKRKLETKEDMYIVPPHYTYFSSLLSCLKKIGVDKDTKVIVALEGKSWRKKYYAPYKAQREGARAEHDLIDWNNEFKKLNKLHDELEKATDWQFIREWDSECDDILSVACRYFKDDEVIIVSGDGDLKQLAYYNNVKFFSIYKKCKGSRGMFELIKDPLKILGDKARKGDISDNIIPSLTDTKEDYDLRYLIVNLLSLPEEIENSIKSIFTNLQPKELDLEKLTFGKNTKEKFLKIYDKQYQITPDYCYQLQIKRDITKKRNKKGCKNLENKRTEKKLKAKKEKNESK